MLHEKGARLAPLFLRFIVALIVDYLAVIGKTARFNKLDYTAQFQGLDQGGLVLPPVSGRGFDLNLQLVPVVRARNDNAGTGHFRVTGDKERLIGVVLNGMSEPIEINGETYQNAMASHAFLTDQQIADVLTFIRQSLGNEADAVMPELVASGRGEMQ